MINADEFDRRVTKRLREINPEITITTLSFYHFADYNLITHTPQFSLSSAKDFDIAQNADGSVSVWYYLVLGPIQKEYKDIEDFETNCFGFFHSVF